MNRKSVGRSCVLMGVLLGVGMGCAPEPADCTGRVVVRDAQDVAAAASCERIDGDLWITSSNLSSLQGLEGLREVRHLVIANNTALEDARGLDGLERVQGVSLWDNPKLSSLGDLAPQAHIGDLAILDGLAGDATELTQRVSGSVSLPAGSDVPSFDGEW